MRYSRTDLEKSLSPSAVASSKVRTARNICFAFTCSRQQRYLRTQSCPIYACSTPAYNSLAAPARTTSKSRWERRVLPVVYLARPSSPSL
eukprot:scaffold431140_cov56-Prasinocladus_malaysianus.AAC.1